MLNTIYMPNSAAQDGRLALIGRQYYHIAFMFQYAVAAGAVPAHYNLLANASGSTYAGKVARTAFEYGSGDSSGTLANAGYSDSIQSVTQSSAGFTSAKKQGAFSSENFSLVLAIGLLPSNLPRRFASDATGVTVASRIGPWAGGVIDPLDSALMDQLTSAVYHSMEVQSLPTNTNEQCGMFLGSIHHMAPGAGWYNSAIVSMNTPDRRGTYCTGGDLVVQPNANSNTFQPNQLLFVAAAPVASVTDNPGAPARTGGDVLMVDFQVIVDVAFVNLYTAAPVPDANGVLVYNQGALVDPVNPGSPAIRAVQAIDDINQARINRIRGQCV